MADGSGTPNIKLTPKQEAFIAACLGGMTQSDAYRAAYSAKNMTDKQVWEEACKLAAHPKVSQRLAIMKQKAAERVILDRAWVLQRLMRNADKALELEDVAASNKALELLGKTDEVPLFVERSIVQSDNRHHHTVDAVSAFDGFLEEAAGSGTEGDPPKPLQN